MSIDGNTVVLDVLDTAGQDEFVAMRDQWIRESFGFLLVYSIASKDSFDQIFMLCKKVLRIKENEMNSIAICLVGNKVRLRIIKKETYVTRGHHFSFLYLPPKHAYFACAPGEYSAIWRKKGKSHRKWLAN